MNRVGFHQTHETQPSRMLYLDSTDAHHLTSLTSHYTYSFKDTIETGPNEGMLVSLSSASIPYSFYNVRGGVNDELHYTVGGLVQTPLPIEPGNYTASSLAKEIVAKFLSEATITFVMSYSKTTQKYSFSTTTENLAFNLDKAQSINHEIGFGDLTGSRSVSTAPASPTVSDFVADLNGSVHAIYVRTNLATKSVMESMTQGVSDILAKVDINTDPGGVITLDPNQVSHEALIHTAGVKQVEIRLTDERNRLLDLNGLHTQLGVKFRFVSVKVADPVAQGDPRARVTPQQVENRRNLDKEKKQQRRKSALRKGKEQTKTADPAPRRTNNQS
jgi:hypothetical protein